MNIRQLLQIVLDNKGSDLHLSGGNPPIVRVYGNLTRLDASVLSGADIALMINDVMSKDERARFDTDKEIDFAISHGDGSRFRVNVFTNSQGAAAVFRAIPGQIPALDDLAAPPVLKTFAGLERGIVLVTGPTGSGKSTTLAAMIDHINTHQDRHIITIEDPLEFVHNSKKSLVNHREVGTHTKSFALALRSALREDPDVILVGEMRDHETIAMALTAAETGHLVFGTLHTTSAAKTVDRIIDVFPAAEKEMIRTMLAGSLQAVVAQALLQRADGRGRVAVHEILVGSHAVRNLIRENKVAQINSMIQVGARYGMQSMQDAVENLVLAGTVTREVANRTLQTASAEDDNSMSLSPEIDAMGINRSGRS